MVPTNIDIEFDLYVVEVIVQYRSHSCRSERNLTIILNYNF